MAVPKERTSKYRKRFHKNFWKGKADRATVKAFSLDESISIGRSKIFYYTTNDKPFGSSKSTGINESNDS